MLDIVVKTLNEAKSVAIYTHINTDCDAMGSSLALKEALNQLGKQADIFVHSAFPNNFKFYGDLSNINKKNCDSYDLAVCLDSPTEARLGKYKFTYRKGLKNTLLIDHHEVSSEKFCKINYVKKASSTAEILFDVFEAMGIKFTQSICKFLLSGIVTDTGRFSYSVSDNTFFVASKLLKLGNLTMEDIVGPLFNSMKREVFEMIKLFYQKLEFYAGGKLAIVVFSHDDFIKNNTSLDELDAFPDLPLVLDDVKFAILSSEDDKGYFRTSLRSKGEISARAVAETFGGGGHKNASGCKIFGEYAEVKQRLIDNTLQTLGWKKWV